MATNEQQLTLAERRIEDPCGPEWVGRGLAEMIRYRALLD